MKSFLCLAFLAACGSLSAVPITVTNGTISFSAGTGTGVATGSYNLTTTTGSMTGFLPVFSGLLGITPSGVPTPWNMDIRIGTSGSDNFSANISLVHNGVTYGLNNMSGSPDDLLGGDLVPTTMRSIDGPFGAYTLTIPFATTIRLVDNFRNVSGQLPRTDFEISGSGQLALNHDHQ